MTLLASVVVVAVLAAPAAQGAPASGVDVRVHEAERRVDVSIDGTPFTAYIWPESLTKPVLFPILTAKGTPVTRGFPLAPRPGERTDHPHQVGLWLSYGDVNGVDFWNNSSALPAEQQAKMGRSVHRRIVSASSGKDEGRLRVAIEWTLPDGAVLLDEDTTFVFRRSGAAGRSLDRISRLTARASPVLLADNKEGFFGLRVARSLEQPSKEPVTLTDAAGRPTTVEALDNIGVTGSYRSSEGKEGDAVWGTRGRWVSLTGRVGEEDVTLAILDDPKNPGAPAYWHARGYGLFAANPLGQKVFSEGRETLDLKVLPRQGVVFRYRLVLLPGAVAPRQLDDAWEAFPERAVSPFDGVIFDLDGTLVANMEIHAEAFQEFLRRHDLPPLDAAMRARIDGKRNRDIFPIVFGHDLAIEDLERYSHEKESLYRGLSRGKLEPLRGVVRFLSRLAEKGIPVAIATSSPEANVPHTLGEIGLLETFPHVARSDTVPRGKPHPDVFLAAAEALGAAPARCLAFEDAPLGVLAAHAAGMRCVAVTTSFTAEDFAAHGAPPDAAVADFEEYLEGPGRWLD